MPKKSFTLLEAIIVLAIISMFLVVGIPFFSKLTSGAKIDIAARNVASVLRTARGYSIYRNTGYGVFFNTSAEPNRYWIYYDLSGTEYLIGKECSLPAGLSFSGVDFTDDKAVFKPTGELDEGESKTVTITNASGEETTSISVEKTTGRIRIGD